MLEANIAQDLEGLLQHRNYEDQFQAWSSNNTREFSSSRPDCNLLDDILHEKLLTDLISQLDHLLAATLQPFKISCYLVQVMPIDF